ncbi:MAG: hypothetical protein R6U66_04195 [Bacteroidales bacterium]
MKRFSYLAIMLSILAFSGCRTMDANLLEAEARNLTMPPFQLEMAAEVTNMRIDLVRQTTTHVISEGTQSTMSSSTEDVPYHPLGVYIGEGIFIDLNENLTMNVLPLIQEQLPAQGKLVAREKAWFGQRKQLNIDAEQWELIESGFFGKKTTLFNLSDSLIEIRPSFLNAGQNIRFEDDRLVYQARGMFSKLSKATIKPVDDGFAEVARWEPLKVHQADENTVEIGRYLTVTRYADKWVFVYEGFLGTYAEYTLLKRDDGYLFFDTHYRGKFINVTPDAVEVTENGKQKIVYTIESTKAQNL